MNIDPGTEAENKRLEKEAQTKREMERLLEEMKRIQ